MKKHRVKEKISFSINLGAQPQPHPLHVADGGLPFVCVRARRQTPLPGGRQVCVFTYRGVTLSCIR